MPDRFEGEVFAGYRRLGAVSVEFEVYERVWYATVSCEQSIDMHAVERVRIKERDFRLEFQSGGGLGVPARFKGLSSPPWKPVVSRSSPPPKNAG